MVPKKGQGRMMKMVATTIKSGRCESQNTALKRLASAVRFRPWPPSFQALTSAQNLNHVPKRSNNLANGGRNLPRCTPTALQRSLQSNSSKFIYGEDTNGRHKKSSGVVKHNDGDFSVVQTTGIDGPEKDLLRDEVQFHREDWEDTREQFQRRLPVGMWLDITTTTEITLRPECTINQVLSFGH
jgi:hypothetical protein